MKNDELLGLEQLHKKALPIYRKASLIALENFGRGYLDYKVKEEYGVKSIVTEADKLINDHLTEKLRKLIPGSSVFSEEGTKELSEDYNWIIDPIDGTGNYQRGVDMWGIAISLKHKNETIYAAILYPTSMNKIYYGFKGKGVFDEKGKKLDIVNSLSFKIKLSVDTPDRELRKLIWELDFGTKSSVMSTGSYVFNGYNMLRGGYDFMLAYKLELYDVDAISFLAKELGHKVVYFNSHDFESLYKVLICKPSVYDKVFDKINECIKNYEGEKN
ncbi:MAG: Myo-inositol-monophosphatase [Candidatus Woesebacteria bacterium GW2011_GWA1_39_12]|uniref:Myo-inositol-monophosphatase n=1 Tax=Candidatus Woesebacteria bacterium GW2011_GWA1_39_12 TaxID=1618549 RepID=A0A0G0PJ59_9BACT|nr:MAG: Myo-inositol-monophosphatase [Candidatus Woesebacteria bacterium GW2011_GWA1_39_12]